MPHMRASRLLECLRTFSDYRHISVTSYQKHPARPSTVTLKLFSSLPKYLNPSIHLPKANHQNNKSSDQKPFMQSLRTTLRQVPTHLKRNRITKPITSTRPLTTTTPKMALFPRFTQEFAPLFRLMDDYDHRVIRPDFEKQLRSVRSFTPKFDVKELEGAYELHGEFPGIEQKDINIEWTDSNTLTVSGRHETVREEGQRPGAVIEGAEGTSEKHHYEKPRVEDEGGDGETQVAKQGSKDVAKSEGGPKYWVSERSVGEFHRSFSFPTRVDQDAVKASLKNGILSIVVPKAKAPQPRKINIE